jgi:murein DD-endopeptidase MepM/ murein hydrolase activator NlpD
MSKARLSTSTASAASVRLVASVALVSSVALVASAAFAVFISCAWTAPANAYNFQGYYCPQAFVSPMRDDAVYTPVGMGVVTSKAGFRVHPVTGKADFHNGVDLGAKLNDRVYCLLDGIVTRVGWRGAMGVAVEVYHPYPNIKTIIGHLNAYAVQPGMLVPPVVLQVYMCTTPL